MKRSSVPTEIDSSWAPAGDDAARGFLWTYQKYDWKGRVTRKIATDGVDSPTLNDSDVLISYEGCGCAGGQVTTIQGELVPRDDQPTVKARRMQKSYADILGRNYKTEVMNWDGSVYSSNIQTFNGRDQVTQSRQYAGTTTSPTYQDTTATFDGHGRLKTSHRPEQQNANQTPPFTSYNYNADDSISNVTDARGVAVNYSYNNRGLADQVSFSVPQGSPIPVTPTVNFTYDSLGNRTQMTDGAGTVTYSYDELSRMTAEIRQFADSMPNAPLPGNRFKLEYSYNLSGRLKSYKDPFGQEINRTFDRSGKLTDITGTSFGGVTSYADNAEYRAWGGLKKADYGSGMNVALDYNNRLRTSGYNLKNASQNAIIDKAYNYNPDGRLKYMQDLLNPNFDRLNTYNSIGSIREGKSGAEARGGTVPVDEQKFNLPYRQSYSFDVFGHLTESNNLHWGERSWAGQSFNKSYAYSNNRLQQAGWTYDEDGRNTGSTTDTDAVNKTFEAAGKQVRALSQYVDSRTVYDGNGAEIKRQTDMLNSEETGWEAQPTKYYIRSSVLKGSVVSEVWADGKKHRSYVKGIGNETAVQTSYAYETAQLNELVLFEFSDTSGMSYRTTNKTGEAAATGDGGEGSPIETDPLGGSVGTFTPFISLVEPYHTEYPQLQPYIPHELPAPDFTSLYTVFGSSIADLPGFGTNWGSFSQLGLQLYSESVWNATHSLEFNPNEYYGGPPGARLTGFGLRYGNGTEVGGNWTLDKALSRIEGSEILFATWDTEEDPFAQTQQQSWFIVGFSDEQFKIIQDQVKFIYSSEACSKAFEAAGLQSVNTMMNSGSLVFVHEGLLGSSTNNSQWGGDENMRKGLLEPYKNKLIDGQSAVGAYEGRYYVSLGNRAFTGWDDTPIHIIIHELIHAGSINGSGAGNKARIPLEDIVHLIGKTGEEGLRETNRSKTPAHDLEWLNYKDGKYTGIYDEIIKNCTPQN